MVYYKRSSFLFTSWDEKNKILLYNYNEFTKALVSKEVMKIVEICFQSGQLYKRFVINFKLVQKSLTTTLQQLVKMEIIDKKNESKKEPLCATTKQWDPIDLAMQRQRSYGGSFPSVKQGRKFTRSN